MKKHTSNILMALLCLVSFLSVAHRYAVEESFGLAWEATVSGGGVVKIYQEQWAGDSLMVDWGDGQTETILSDGGIFRFSHTFRGQGPFQLRVSTEIAAIHRLTIQGRTVRALDLGNLPGLVDLVASGCRLEGGLDLSGCQAILGADLSFNQLTSLNLGRSSQLRALNLSHNRLSQIQGLSGCQGLEQLDISENQMSALAVGNLENLQWLNAAYNQLSQAMDLRNNRRLKICRLESNEIPSVEIASLSELQQLTLSDNAISNLSQVVTDLEQSYQSWRQAAASQAVLKRAAKIHQLSLQGNPSALNTAAQARINTLRSYQWHITH